MFITLVSVLWKLLYCQTSSGYIANGYLSTTDRIFCPTCVQIHTLHSYWPMYQIKYVCMYDHNDQLTQSQGGRFRDVQLYSPFIGYGTCNPNNLAAHTV